MRALLDDLALIHDDNPVHPRDGRKPVRDGQHGFALHHPIERVLDQRFNLAIERACGLIQHQDRRVFQYGAGQCNALALPARQFDAALAQMRVIAAAALKIAKFGDKIVGLGLLRGSV